jgi:pimeloyl-ACP methyl ester carboxylesterase
MLVNMRMISILAIHGAWSSSISFNYLRSQISGCEWHTVDYDHSRDDLPEIIRRAQDAIVGPVVVVGHSLGGIAALHLHDRDETKGIITLASPLAGLELNLIQLYFTRSSLIRQIACDTALIRDMKRKEYGKPVLHLIANRGFNPFIYEDNDGVLPRKIQLGWSCGSIKEIAANHYEILQCEHTVQEIKRWLHCIDA